VKRFLTSSILAAFSIATLMAADPVSRRDAARLQAKIDRINKLAGVRTSSGNRTPVTETEVNSYLRYELGDRMPTGVRDPWVSMIGEGRLTGTATVDLGQVAQSRKSGGMLDPYSLLSGSLPLTVNGLLKTANGVGTFTLESASVSGVPVPSWMIQEIVSYYSKSPTTPQGVALDRPFALPSGIKEIQLDRGQAIVVQ
jgi:hypothetical protein